MRSSVLVMDFSADTYIEAKQEATAHIINSIVQHAMKVRYSEDFACIIAVEEAQYFAPEKGAEITSSKVQNVVKKSFIEAVSRAGGYNVGF